ncbi:MAG TPA: hypothetical protein VN931_12080 [Fibrobacteria bacterium]|nr:hypothetical protein [Fibrobacteria bacterium]
MCRWISCLGLCVVLTGCDALKPDTSSLLGSNSGVPQERLRCDACHGFAPHTGAHRYHLDTTFQLTYLDTTYGKRHVTTDVQITCADCHSASIAMMPGPVLDSIYQIPGRSEVYHTAGWPWLPFSRTAGTLLDTVTVDSVPLAYAPREAGAENPFWVTRSSPNPHEPGHANGAVDIVFPERDAYWKSPVDGSIHKAVWNPAKLSCAAVACHGSQSLDDSIKYTWRQP